MSDERSWIRWLDESGALDALAGQLIDQVGGKGANLLRLTQSGFPVPRGFVVTTAAYRAVLAANNLAGLAVSEPEAMQARLARAPIPDEFSAAILAAYQRLGAHAVAVRSSGTAEDLASASFAGQYDTFLDITGPEAVLDAIRACWASLWTPRAIAYRRQHGWDDPANRNADLALAVIVQVMVPAAAAGVAFTANPVTGDRAETIISAVRGLGERLVSGEGVADEWVVRGMEAICTRDAERALTEPRVLAIAALARRIEERFGAPQDVEWAIDTSGRLFALQARPMTALPESNAPPIWTSPAKGGWMRNFRLGEWLPEPLTPLCDSWLLARIEEGEIQAEERDFGLRPRPPYHVLANGWYFSSPIGGGAPFRSIVKALTGHPLQIAALALSTSQPDLADRLFIAPVTRRWQDALLPRYQRLVALWEGRLETASMAELTQGIDAVASEAGEYLWAFSVAGGHAWKAEHALARFCRQRLPNLAHRGYQALLLGLPVNLPPPYPAAAPHAVESLDWIRPPLGAAHTDMGNMPALEQRRARMAQDRRATEAECRHALASHARLRRRFDTLLALAQRYAILREEQACWFTFGWPFMRQAALRLGEALRLRGVIAHADDVFFLTRDEVETHLGLGAGRAAERAVEAAGNLQALVIARHGAWDRQRRLSPPLTLGNPLGARVIARATNAMRSPAAEPLDTGSPGDPERQHALRGMPASPGRATGPARVIRGSDDFDRFMPGEVLVAQVTTPAWTPLLGRAAAVVTDGGSLAAHASLVAREVGIPAVVATGNATARVRDGQIVTVDGSAGVVELKV